MGGSVGGGRSRPLRHGGGAAPGFATLTGKEREIAMLVGEGAMNREVAAALSVSPKTVEFHLTRVYAKLGVRSRTELALALVRSDLVERGTDETRDSPSARRRPDVLASASMLPARSRR